MNKVFNINLGGYPFTIDDDAYEHLSQYLNTIHNHFRASQGYEEITGDIESRIAELFQERLGGKSIVTIKEVREAIEIMGTPEDFGAEPIDDSTYQGKNQAQSAEKQYKTGKRLFRDEEEKVIGGVCSGIAAYLGIADPLWVRLAFAGLAFLTGGFWVVLYIILMVIVPKAVSAADRLAMKGEPINVSNIAKTVEQEAKNFAEQISELGNEFGKKKMDGSGAYGTARRSIAQGVSFLGSLARYAILGVFKIIRPLFIFVVGALLLGLIVAWIASVFGAFYGPPFANYVVKGSGIPFGLPVFNLFMLFGIPVIGLVLFFSRIAFRTHVSPYVKAGMGAFWIINAFSLAMAGIKVVSEFNESADIKVPAPLEMTSDTLTVIIDDDRYSKKLTKIDHVQLGDNKLIINDIEGAIEKSKGNQFEIEKKISTHGRNETEAQSIATATVYDYKLTDNTLTLPNRFFVPKGEKWRNQHVRIALKVPAGKYVRFRFTENSFEYDLNSFFESRDMQNPDDYLEANALYKMEENGLFCPVCDKMRNQSRTFDFNNFNKVYIENNMTGEIIQGDKFSIVLKGSDEALKTVDVVQTGESVFIDRKGEDSDSRDISVKITLPRLNELSLEHTSDFVIRGFKQEKMSLTIRTDEESKFKAIIDVENLKIRQEGRHNLDLVGIGKYLDVHAEGDVTLDAKRFSTKMTELDMEDGAHGVIMASDTLIQRQNIDGLRIEGNPVIKRIWEN